MSNIKHLQSVSSRCLPKEVPLSSVKRHDASAREEQQHTQPLQSDTLLATILVQLTDLYGARFSNTTDAKNAGVWQYVLGDLTEDDVRRGLQAMLSDERFETWPPNATQLRHLCLKGKTGALPSVHKAFAEARQNALYPAPLWSHKAVKFTVKYVGVDVVNSAYTHEAFQTFSRAYEKVCERISEGFMIPDVADEEVSYYHRQKTKNAVSRIKNNHISLRSLLHHGHC